MNDLKSRARIEKTRWDSFSRVDLGGTINDQMKLLFTDGGAVSQMFKFNGDFNSVSGLKQDLGRSGPNTEVLTGVGTSYL